MANCGKRTLITVVVFLAYLFTISPDPAFAAKSRMKVEAAHRVDLRDLGYLMVNEIPPDSSAVTSLVTAGDGMIYGGTSGDQAYLFLYDPSINKVRHLGRVKSEPGIHHALVEDKDGYIYIGTGKSILDDIRLSKWGLDLGNKNMISWSDIDKNFQGYSDHVLYEMMQSKNVMGFQYIDIILWNDIENHFKDYPGGHLYRYNPKANNDKVKLPDMDCDLEDLGIPVPNNSIYALTISPKGDTIYGMTYPDGRFFVYDIAAKTFKDIGEIDPQITFHGPERHWRSLPRALICDDTGRVYTSANNGLLKYYSPDSQKMVSTGLKIPGDYYYAQSYTDYAVVDYFAKNTSGLIYGGTSDGYLFSFDPKETKLVNLGKPRAARRLRCLTVANDGKVYLVAGERSAGRPCQFYAYDPQVGGFEDLGLLSVDRSPYYLWRGFQFDSMTTGSDGTIYLGESERRSHLFLYIP